MNLQSLAPGMRRSVIRWALVAMACCPVSVALVCALPAVASAQQDNFGLGPMSIRNQFPVTLAFLTYEPETAKTLAQGRLQLRYQFELTNSFVNTESPRGKKPPYIDTSVINAGLTTADFPATGYGVYIDVESQRHVLRLDYGLTDSLQVGLEMAWVSFGGGFLDNRITTVERLFGGLNKDRPYSPVNHYDYYLSRDGSFLHASDTPISGVPQDPVLNLKWNLGAGGAVLPALSVKLAYKDPLQAHPTGNRSLVSSGGADWGYYVMLSKAVGDVVGHIQFGRTHLDVKPNTYSDHLNHRMFGLEFRLGSTDSIVMESVNQTSIYLKDNVPGTINFDISRPTDVLVAGYKHVGHTVLYELGFIEDYNQQRNEADISGYLATGVRW